MYKVTFYVPKKDCERVKAAMFQAGAGKIGNYDACSWQTLGEGQFRPQDGATPHVGEIGTLETIAEYKVEMVCQPSHIQDVIKALKSMHPYETPAYEVYKIEPF